MKKLSILSSLTLSLCLLGTTCWLLVSPITVKAADCTASCGIAPSVSCSGSGACYAQDGWGCKASNGPHSAPMINLCQVY